MTLAEAIDKTIERCDGQIKAVQAANNGRPIVLPDGRPINFKAPNLGDLLLTVIQAQSIGLQLGKFLAGSLQGGFVLTDQEAGRIADLVVEKLAPKTSGSS